MTDRKITARVTEVNEADRTVSVRPVGFNAVVNPFTLEIGLPLPMKDQEVTLTGNFSGAVFSISKMEL